jgi:DNA-binding transcriptional LysR family regulator
MERVRRLRELWGWLPSFRAAAETEHLPTASELLHVSASSISRTVRLLEQQLGVDLFERGGRSMTLVSCAASGRAASP